MADLSRLYPPAPVAVPDDLTAPSPEYRTRVIIVLMCLIVFVAVYLALTVGSAVACYWCFAELTEPDPPPVRAAPQPQPKTVVVRTPDGRAVTQTYFPPAPPVAQPRPPRSEKPVFLLVLGGVTAGLICLYMVKGLFKGRRRDDGARVEVTEAEQPVLFAFIRRLCAETGAPFPHRVYLVPEVNAAVSFHESFLNLVFPSRKNLIIGLALVNRLNLTEFKAVLAHEFGHFSQNSMRLGSYVYTSNRIIADVVYGRDWLDDVLGTLRGTDVRIAVFAWGFTAILWTMRKGLELMYRGINFAHVSLSRQMEYNADLVAVRASGSDALIFALARLDFAADALGQAWADLTAAADHNRFTRDLYYHHTKAAEFLKARRNDPKLGEVPPLPETPTETVQVFKPEDTSVPKMWATHPSNHDREVNAKRRYVRGPVDERSAWELFENPAAVRAAVTRKVYLSARKANPEVLEEPEAIQEFIDAEHAETTYNPRYHGLYENRYIKPGDLAELCTASAREDLADPDKLAAAFAGLYGADLKERMDAQKVRGEEINKLARITHGAAELTGADFEHRGRRYRRADAPKLLKDVEGEIDKEFERMHALDREAFRVHYAMALQLGEADAEELAGWYTFHAAVQDMHSLLVAHNRHVQTTHAALGIERQVSQTTYQNFLGAVLGAHEALRVQLKAAGGLLLPPLKNMAAGSALGPFLLVEPLVSEMRPDAVSIEGAWLYRLMNQMGEVIDKLARILFKSLGGLLALQERIAERWETARTAPPPAEPPPAEVAAEAAPPPPESPLAPAAPPAEPDAPRPE
jgi:Zn-dependent protease with chaperone function